ncbi:MAG: DNA cytosine methyltransferase [Microcoleaceae cyanobacterium MO_207.B10]|nr:DNA cytosine methyltransferase [Microcoleaceae cyanobacterium MO_207.B10]
MEETGYDFVNSKISSGINGIAKVYLPHTDVIATLTATGTKDFVAKKTIEFQQPQAYKQTFILEIYIKGKIQPLSAKDYAKLQGFPDWFIIAENESVTKKKFGNAVSVPVVYHLVKSLVEVIL